MPANSSPDEDRNAHVPVEPCELPDGIQLVYADDRGRQRTVALEDVTLLDFGQVKAFRKPPAYRGQRLFCKHLLAELAINDMFVLRTTGIFPLCRATSRSKPAGTAC
jgi:hypothetical protein